MLTLGRIQQRHLAKRTLCQELILLAISGQVELGCSDLDTVVLGGDQSLECAEISGKRIKSLQVEVAVKSSSETRQISRGTTRGVASRHKACRGEAIEHVPRPWLQWDECNKIRKAKSSVWYVFKVNGVN